MVRTGKPSPQERIDLHRRMAQSVPSAGGHDGRVFARGALYHSPCFIGGEAIVLGDPGWRHLLNRQRGRLLGRGQPYGRGPVRSFRLAGRHRLSAPQRDVRVELFPQRSGQRKLRLFLGQSGPVRAAVGVGNLHRPQVDFLAGDQADGGEHGQHRTLRPATWAPAAVAAAGSAVPCPGDGCLRAAPHDRHAAAGCARIRRQRGAHPCRDRPRPHPARRRL